MNGETRRIILLCAAQWAGRLCYNQPIMSKKQTPLVIANWKMNPRSVAGAKALFYDIQKAIARVRGVDIGITPPAVYLSDLKRLVKGKRIRLGAQDVFFGSTGAHTGELSVPMLRSVGASYVITGHSERRARGESDEEVYKDTRAVLKGGMVAVVCLGEKKRDTHGHYFGTVECQLRAALHSVQKNKLGNVVIVYEPVWAISTSAKGHVATPHDAHEMKLFIQKTLSDMFGRAALSKVRILYGGSVTAKNAEGMLRAGAVDGFLVGGASLRANEFAKIVKTASSLR